MQIKFYGKTYSFNTKDELGRVLDDIYYQYQDLRRDIPRKYEEKASKELDKLEREFQDTYRKARNMGDDLKNSKGEDMNHYEKIIQEKKNMKLEAKEEYKGYIIEVYKDNKYIYLAYKKGSSSMHKYAYGEADSVSEGISRAKNALDVDNSKDNSKSYYQSIIEKKNALPEFKYCYQAMQWFKDGGQYAEVIDKLVDRFHLDKSTAAAAAQKGQQMYEDSYRNK